MLSDVEKAVVADIHTVRETTSKKNPDIRRSELVQYISPYLLPIVEQRAAELSTLGYGCQFITEVLLECQGDKSTAVNAVANIASGDLSSAEHVVHNPAVGKMLRALVSGGKFDFETKKINLTEPRLGFAGVLLKQLKGTLVDWAVSPISFVVVALLETEDLEEAEKEAVRGELKKGKKVIEKAASGKDQAARAEAPTDGGKAAKGKKKKGEALKGNAGARIILEKL